MNTFGRKFNSLRRRYGLRRDWPAQDARIRIVSNVDGSTFEDVTGLCTLCFDDDALG
jgi:hypothetical protein